MSTPFPERWKRWNYLQDVDLWLSALPRARRKEICRDLREGLTAAAVQRGMAAAIDDLGPARRLAREYLEGEPRTRPTWSYGGVAALTTWSYGGVAALTTFMTFVAAFTLYAAGMLDAVEHAGASTATGSFLGARLVAESNAHTLGVTFEGFSWPAFIGCVLAWMIGARIWRLVHRREPSERSG